MLINSSCGGSSCTAVDLQPGHTYEVALTACFNGGDGEQKIVCSDHSEYEAFITSPAGKPNI